MPSYLIDTMLLACGPDALQGISELTLEKFAMEPSTAKALAAGGLQGNQV